METKDTGWRKNKQGKWYNINWAKQKSNKSYSGNNNNIKQKAAEKLQGNSIKNKVKDKLNKEKSSSEIYKEMNNVSKRQEAIIEERIKATQGMSRRDPKRALIAKPFDEEYDKLNEKRLELLKRYKEQEEREKAQKLKEAKELVERNKERTERDKKRKEEKYKAALRSVGAKETLRDESNDILKTMSQEQRDVIDFYKGNEYKDFNAILRGNTDLYEIGYNDKDRKQFDNRVKILDNIIEKNGRTDYGDYYYRGTSMIEVKGIKVGDVYNPKQYISSSLLEDVCHSFMGDKGEDVVIKFNNKNKRIKGFYMDPDDDMEEFEVLMGRNKKFVCTNITKENNRFVYEMEVQDV